MPSEIQTSPSYAPLVYERLNDYRRSALIVSQLPTVQTCAATRELVTPDWYEQQYIPQQPNIDLLRQQQLPGELLGLVIRRDVEWRGSRRGLFLIQVGEIANSFAEHFAIAHELGHVLLHGRLMYAGMVVSEVSWEATADEDDRRRLLELEANVYALLSIVPDPAIDALEAVLGETPTAGALQRAMQWLAGEAFDLQLSRERLLLHRTLRSSIEVEDFQRVIGRHARSWTLHGSAVSEPINDLSNEAPSEAQLHEWLTRLCERRILNARHWPLARKRLAAASRDAIDAFAWAMPRLV